LADPIWRDAISDYLSKYPEHKLLILDNISSLIPGVNENDKKDWDPINQWLLSLRRTGNSVILIHHANKKGTDRGHSGRIDNLDNVLRLEAVGNSDQVKFQVNFEKSRYLKPGEAKPFSMELMEAEDGFVWVTGAIKESDDTFKEVIKLLSEGALQKQVVEELGISQGRVSQLRQKAIKDGYLDTKNHLTEDGEEFLQEQE
jgi:putative DNA primase/helicase